MSTKHLTPKEVKIETIESLDPTEYYKFKWVIYVDLSDIESEYHEMVSTNITERWKLFEPNVPVIVLPYICDKKEI